MDRHSIRTARHLAVAALLAAPLMLPASIATAGETEKPTATAATTAPKPMTAAEHLAKAEEYAKKAAAYRAEATLHRKMLADFRTAAVTERADEDPDRKAMRIHCEGYYKKADALAAEAEKFADYHRMRAAELKGK